MTNISNQQTSTYTLSPDAEKIRSRMLKPFFLKLYQSKKLPLALVAGIKLQRLDVNGCDVSVPYRWLTTNPFHSTYFAALSMAAELSTGALALMAVQNSPDPISLLIVGLKANFVKKATSLTTFSCSQGQKLFAAVQQASNAEEDVVIDLQSIGRNPDNSVIAEFMFRWSFKRRG